MSRSYGKHAKPITHNESRPPSHSRTRAAASMSGSPQAPAHVRTPGRSLKHLPLIDAPQPRANASSTQQGSSLPSMETPFPQLDVSLSQTDSAGRSHGKPARGIDSPRATAPTSPRHGAQSARVVRRKPHRRHNERFYSLRSLLRSPLFAYATAAVVLTVLLFVLTVPTPHYTDAESTQGNSADAVVKPYPQNEELVDPRPVAHPLEGTSAAAVAATNAYGVLTQAVGEFEDTGDLISFAMRDLTTGNTLTYDSGRVQYPASSIKAPYTCAVYELLLETGAANYEEVRPLAEATILESSDDAYRDLHDAYGMDVFATWMQEAGVGPGEYSSYGEMLIWNYPHLNCDQLLGMWLHICDYVQRDTPFAQHFGSLLEQRQVSAMRAALGTDVRTQSKMGWFDYYGDYFSEPATVEAGIVYAPEGAYTVAVMTTAPAEIAELQPIFAALARAHYDMI